MRTMRSGLVLAAAAIGAAMIAVPALSAQQQDLYPATLDFGTGLIDIPVAWISPNSSDIWVQSSAKQIPYNAASSPDLNFASRWNTNMSIDTHWAGRFSLGVSLYSQNPELGVFGQALLLKESADHPWPAIAVGFRNLGSFDHEDRLLIGHDVTPSGTEGETASWARRFHTAPSVYGVATKSMAVGASGTASLTVGWGSGLFADDGDLGAAYNDKGQIASGLFLGGRYALHPTENTRLDFLAENNGWDWNAGIVGSWRGLSLGVYGTELEEGGKNPSKGPLYTIYNYAKFNLALGYSGNLHDIAHGTILRTRIAELEQEQLRLRAQIAQRQHKIEELQVALQKAQGGELAEVAKRREQLDSQIQEEQEAIKRAEERLNQLQGGPPAPATATPPSTTTPPR
jgi:hypothetical protein